MGDGDHHRGDGVVVCNPVRLEGSRLMYCRHPSCKGVLKEKKMGRADIFVCKECSALHAISTKDGARHYGLLA